MPQQGLTFNPRVFPVRVFPGNMKRYNLWRGRRRDGLIRFSDAAVVDGAVHDVDNTLDKLSSASLFI